MADFVFNVSKGMVRYYAGLPAASDALVAVPIEDAAIETDDILKDYVDLGSLLAGPSNEQVTMGRLTINTGIVGNQDNANNRWDCDITTDPVWPVADGNPIRKVLICYKPASNSTDSVIVPMTAHDTLVAGVPADPNGGSFTLQLAAAGFYRAQD